MTHVLLVEDKEENLYYLEALFRGHGWTVEKARHGAEALVLARQRLPQICISDLLMPVMDGYTLLRQWKVDAKLRHVPFIVYTATYTEPADEKLALDLGADAFVLKPAEPDAFLAKVHEVLAREHTSAPRVITGDDDALLENYSQTLIRKLEEKTIELEATNAALERDIAERERAERERQALLRELNERVKELRALHRVSDLLREDRYQGERLLQEVVNVLPGAMQRPDLASVQLEIDGLRAESRGFAASAHCIRSDVRLASGQHGAITVCCGEGAPPFLDEERSLLDSVAAMLASHLDRKAVLERLATSQARLREQAELLDKAQDAILVRDLTQRITFWNKSAERLYGWSADEAIGQLVTELLKPDTTEFDQALTSLLSTGEWMGELHQRSKDGRPIVIEGRWTLVRDDAGHPTHILAINTDITARKSLESQFLRAQRLESIGTLAGGIAHDLNNVLAPIMMGIDLLRDELRDPRSRETLDLIANSARRGAEMVKQVLTFARGVDGRHRLLDPGDAVRDVTRIARDTFPRSIDVVTEMDAALWTVQADPTQLHQVLLNLCVNARDAMPTGGTLVVSATNVTLDRQYAAMNLEAREGPYVRLTVQDTGLGIPAGVLERIFDPFFTTKEVGKGTGLGLSTTLAIVKAHKGFIRVYSEPGSGSTFRVYLPARPATAAASPAAGDGEWPRGQGETILVVDDEESIRNVTATTLAEYGYRVLLAVDGSEAVSVFLRHRQEVRLVLTDMMMPVMDGRATIEVLRRLEPTLKIVGVSGLPVGQGLGGEGAAVVDFLQKPYTAATLLRTIRSALGR